jgi:tight adherence protein C
MKQAFYVLPWAGTACICAALGLVAYHLLAAAKAPANTLGFRGMKRSEALEQLAWFRALDPLLRWLEPFVRAPLSVAAERRLDRFLMGAGDYLGLTAGGFLALSLFAAVLGATSGLVFVQLSGRSAFYVVGGAVLAGLLPYLELWALTERRRKNIRQALPYCIDLLALGLSAGLDFPGAVRQVLDTNRTPNDPLMEELRLILQELTVGKTRREALLQLKERVPIACVHEFVGSVVQAEEHGNPLGPVLQIHAGVSREERSVRAEESASKASVKLLVPMVFLLVAVLALVVSPMFFEIKQTLR